jgi:flagellar protein FliO/FliZ
MRSRPPLRLDIGASDRPDSGGQRRPLACSVTGVSPTAAYLVETLVTLLAVLAVAVLVLVGARKLGVGAPSGPLELVGRLPLDARRVIYLVRVGPQVLVVGASEAGLIKLSEVPHSDVPEAPRAPERAFSALLRRASPGGGRGSVEASTPVPTGGEGMAGSTGVTDEDKAASRLSARAGAERAGHGEPGGLGQADGLFGA